MPHGRLAEETLQVCEWDVFTRRPAHPRDVPPVVLVHGLSVSSEYMLPLAEALHDGFDVFAPDLPGFGQSGKPDRTLDIPELARALASYLDAAGLARPAFVANSLGCQVVAQFAADFPGRAGALVFVGPTMDPAFSTADLVWRLVQDAAKEDPALLGVHLADDLRAGPTRAWGTFQAALSHDMEDALRRLEAPVLVVRGERDPLVTEAWARRVAELCGGSYRELPGAPHAANFSAPGPLAEAIAPFLRASFAAQTGEEKEAEPPSG